jgi:hypothetical protein
MRSDVPEQKCDKNDQQIVAFVGRFPMLIEKWVIFAIGELYPSG